MAFMRITGDNSVEVVGNINESLKRLTRTISVQYRLGAEMVTGREISHAGNVEAVRNEWYSSYEGWDDDQKKKLKLFLGDTSIHIAIPF